MGKKKIRGGGGRGEDGKLKRNRNKDNNDSPNQNSLSKAQSLFFGKDFKKISLQNLFNSPIIKTKPIFAVRLWGVEKMLIIIFILKFGASLNVFFYQLKGF